MFINLLQFKGFLVHSLVCDAAKLLWRGGGVNRCRVFPWHRGKNVVTSVFAGHKLQRFQVYAKIACIKSTWTNED